VAWKWLILGGFEVRKVFGDIYVGTGEMVSDLLCDGCHFIVMR
jgi:hypothetical protein